MQKSGKGGLAVLNVAMFLVMLAMLSPFFIVIVNAVKPLTEITKDVLALPTSLYLDNLVMAYRKMNFTSAFFNTLSITILANAGLILFGAMAGYWLIRRPSKLNNFLYVLLLGSMAFPFQAVMIPLVRVMKALGMHGSIPGLAFGYWGLGCSTVIFLTYGAIKSIPYEIEEAGIIDGCSQLTLYFRIIFPLLRTIVLTFTILNTFWFWNDFLMPQLMIGNVKSLRTIQMAIRTFRGEYLARWDYLLAGLVIALIPPVIFFIFCQKKIIDGMVSGAVKG